MSGMPVGLALSNQISLALEIGSWKKKKKHYLRLPETLQAVLINFVCKLDILLNLKLYGKLSEISQV